MSYEQLEREAIQSVDKAIESAGKAPTPVCFEPLVQEAHAQLGPGSARPDPFQQPKAKDGRPDPGFEDLMAVGWNEELARNISAVPADEKVPLELGKLFHQAVTNGYFQSNVSRANALWLKDENGPETGYIPQPGSGILPTGAQMRRYCVKLNWDTPSSFRSSDKSNQFEKAGA